MRIIATIHEAADIVRKCEERRKSTLCNICSDCVLREACEGPLSLPDLFTVVPKIITAPDSDESDYEYK